MAIVREPEKLAEIEKQIEDVKSNGYGQVVITITDGQITDSKLTVGSHWSLSSPEELEKKEIKKEILLTVITPIS